MGPIPPRAGGRPGSPTRAAIVASDGPRPPLKPCKRACRVYAPRDPIPQGPGSIPGCPADGVTGLGMAYVYQECSAP